MVKMLLLVFAGSLVRWCHTSVNNNKVAKADTVSKMKIGVKIFTATVYDNPTAIAFKRMVPVTLGMIELNANKKYADLPGR